MTLEGTRLQQAMAASLTQQTMQKIAGAQAAVFESVVCDIYRVRRELDKAEDRETALAMIDHLADKLLRSQAAALLRAQQCGQMANDLREAVGMNVEPQAGPETKSDSEPELAELPKDRRSCIEEQ